MFCKEGGGGEVGIVEQKVDEWWRDHERRGGRCDAGSAGALSRGQTEYWPSDIGLSFQQAWPACVHGFLQRKSAWLVKEIQDQLAACRVLLLMSCHHSLTDVGGAELREA
jgi:hypothetical protein